MIIKRLLDPSNDIHTCHRARYRIYTDSKKKKTLTFKSGKKKKMHETPTTTSRSHKTAVIFFMRFPRLRSGIVFELNEKPPVPGTYIIWPHNIIILVRLITTLSLCRISTHETVAIRLYIIRQPAGKRGRTLIRRFVNHVFYRRILPRYSRHKTIRV